MTKTFSIYYVLILVKLIDVQRSPSKKKEKKKRKEKRSMKVPMILIRGASKVVFWIEV